MMEIENVKEKIRAMLNMTRANGCSEGEAMNAAGLVGKLLTTYNLTLDKVILDAETCIDMVIDTGRKARHPISHCLTSLADFTDTKCWITSSYDMQTYQKSQKYHFFGLPTDTEMAKYLYDLILTAIDQETENFKSTSIYRNKQSMGVHGRRTTISFQKGMSGRISARLSQMTQERHLAERANNVTWIDPLTTQVRHGDIVLVKKNKVEDDFEKLGVRLRSAARRRSGYDWESRTAGEAAGSRVNLNRPMNHSAGLAGYLE